MKQNFFLKKRRQKGGKNHLLSIRKYEHAARALGWVAWKVGFLRRKASLLFFFPSFLFTRRKCGGSIHWWMFCFCFSSLSVTHTRQSEEAPSTHLQVQHAVVREGVVRQAVRVTRAGRVGRKRVEGGKVGEISRWMEKSSVASCGQRAVHDALLSC